MIDELLIRCPRLGGEVTFGYCRQEGGEVPCGRVLACWQSCFPVVEYLRVKLTPAQWGLFSCREPKEKIVTIVELAEKSRVGE